MPLTQWVQDFWRNRKTRRAQRAIDRRARLRVRRLGERRVYTITAVDIGGGSTTIADGAAYTLPTSTYTVDNSQDTPHTATVDWGDGNSEALTITQDGDVFFPGTVAGTAHNYAAPGDYTVTVTVEDASFTQASDTLTVTVNSPPVVTATGSTLNYTENAGPVAIDPNLTISDVNSTNLTSAVVTFQSGYVGGQDVLSFTDTSKITGDWNPGTGTLTLQLTAAGVGATSVGEFEAALRSITYTNNSQNPSTATRTLSFQVNDGFNASNTATRDINVATTNDAPTITLPATLSTDEDTNLVLSSGNGNAIQIADADAGNNVVWTTITVTNGTAAVTIGSGVTLVAGALNSTTFSLQGTVADINSTLASGVTFSPTGNFNGNANLTVEVDDLGNSGGPAESTTASRTITVNSVNDAPTIANNPTTFTSVNEDTDSAAISVAALLGTAAYADGDSTGVSGIAVIGQTGNGTWEFSSDGTTWTSFGSVAAGTALLLDSGSQVRYAPDRAKGETATFTFVGWDQATGTASAGATARYGNASSRGGATAYSTQTASASITITDVNDAPVNTVPIGLQTDEDTPLTVSTISVADVDAGTDNLETRLSVTNGTVSVTPAGSATIVAGADGTSTLTLRGSLTDINATLAAGVTITPAANFHGLMNFGVSTDDLGHNGGPAQQVNDVRGILVDPVNDAPTITNTPTTFTGVNEDTTSAAITVGAMLTTAGYADVDATGITGMAVIGKTGNGTWEYSTDGTTWISFGSVAAGTALLLDAATQVRYVPDGIDAETATFTFVGWDQTTGTASGATASYANAATRGNATAFSTQSTTGSITITSVNDAPVNTLPAGPLSTNEDTALVLSGATKISIADVDAGSDNVQVKLTVTSGTLGVALGGGVTISAGANNSATLTLQGSVTNINTVLASGVTFTPASNSTTSVTLTVDTTDLGNNGATGGTKTDSDSLTINITAVNDRPTLTGSNTTLSAISEDIASGSNSGVTVASLLTTAGYGDVDGTANKGIAVTAASGSHGNWEYSVDGGSNWINFGAVSTTGALLLDQTARVRFQPDGEDGGNASFTFVGWDKTSGTASTATPSYADATSVDATSAYSTAAKNVSITVNAVNDAPVNTLPTGPLSTNEDTPLTITGISIADVDAGGDTVQTKLTVASGTLAVTLSGGVSIFAGANNSSTITLRGSVADINTTLASGVTFTPASNSTTSVDLDVDTSDLGNNGGGGTLTDSDSVTIDITPLNDRPTLTGSNTTLTAISEDLTSLLNTGVTVASLLTTAGYGDADGTSDKGIAVTSASGSHGVWQFSVDAGLNWIDFGGVSTTGALLLDQTAKVRFQPDGEDGGNASFTFVGWDTTSDTASTAVPSYADATSTGPTSAYSTASKTASITVNSVNDAPVNTLPAGPLSTNEDTALTITGISIADVDAGSDTIETRLTVGSGVLNVTLVVGVNISAGANNSSSLTLQGSIADINAVLATGVTFTPAANSTTAVTLTVRTDDLGNNGSGGSRVKQDTLTINITAVNDRPTLGGSNTTLTAISEDLASASNNGVTVASLLTTAGYGDVDGTANKGIAVTAASGSHGNWEYSVDGGSNWINFGAVSTTGALLLDQTARVRFQPDGEDGGNASFTFVGWDKTSGTASTATPSYADATSVDATSAYSTAAKTVSITVNAVNDAPVNTLPTGLSTDEDTPLTVTGISIADVDAGTGLIRTTISVTNAVVSVTPGAGVSIVAGASGTTTLTLEGQLTDVNATLASGVTITPANDFDGTVVLSVSTTDQGNSGGAALTDSDSVNITINPVDDPTLVTLNATSRDYNERAAPVLLAPTLTLFDSDDVTLAFAVVEITAGFDTGNDVLSFTVPSGSGITSSYVNGKLTLTGPASLADFQLALRSVTFSNTSFDPSTAARTLSFSVNDGSSTGPVVTMTVNLLPFNDPPTIAAIANQTGNPGQQIGPITITLSDPDDDPSTLTVTATSNNAALFPNSTDFVVTYVDATTRQLTLNPAAGVNGFADVTVTVSDNSTLGAKTTSTTFRVTVSRPPDITLPGNFSTPEDVTTAFLFLASDPEGQALNLSFRSSDQSIVTDGSISIFPWSAGTYVAVIPVVANANGPVTLTLTATDQDGQSSTGSFVLTVTPVNDLPSVNVVAPLETEEDNAVTGSLTGDDGDPDAVQALTFSLASGPAHGSVVVQANGNFTYTPAPDFSGIDSFVVQVTDDNAFGDGSRTSAGRTVQIVVTPVADAPRFSVVAPTTTGVENVLGGFGFQILPSDADGSETITTVKIENVPLIAAIVDASGVEYAHTFSLVLGIPHKTYNLTGAQFNSARIRSLDNLSDTLDFTITSTEGGAARDPLDQSNTITDSVPIEIANTPPQITSFTGTDIAADARATINALITDAPLDTFRVVITWGVSAIGFDQRTILGLLGPRIASLQEGFTFLIAPDPRNPAAPVTITMEVTDKDGGVTTESVTVSVIGNGISTTIVRDLGATVSAVPQILYVAEIVQSAPSAAPPAVNFNDDAHVSGERTIESTRVVILRIVSSQGVESAASHRLPETVLGDLTKFLGKLPDGHYRLYLSESSFTPPRMLADVMMFRGRAVAPGDMQAHRPPTQHVAKLNGKTPPQPIMAAQPATTRQQEEDEEQQEESSPPDGGPQLIAPVPERSGARDERGR